MTTFLTYIASGLAVGASFALIGSGFVVVHRVTNVVNFTQGTLTVLGGLISYSLLSMAIPHGLGEVAAVLIAAVAGLLVGLVTLSRPGTPAFVALLVTLGLSFLGTAIIILVWGQNPVSPPGIEGSIAFGSVSIESQRVLIVVVTLAVFGAMWLFFERTDLGRAMSAAASNQRAARLVGIDVRRMGLAAFAIAGALGGLAGVLLAPTLPLSVYSDLPLALSGFAAAVFGGLSSPGRTLIGAMVLGVSGQLVAGYINGSFQTQLALVMMLVVMIARHRSLTTEEAK
ncbi:branched-chain amino acid ABC transporter permease [Pseudolysinimonas sp.]|uniref:branched-chain amino acid ABC transporter permease n=1 Tax=Pseudolysinimonas sp. TaxID=2680009 RepID=UPI00286D6562|nr:branched-chain amino acid ABC transporter permease [Pseudolysinimonas sp.]